MNEVHDNCGRAKASDMMRHKANGLIEEAKMLLLLADVLDRTNDPNLAPGTEAENYLWMLINRR